MSADVIAVLGAGGWGTALAALAASRGHAVTLWGRRADLVEEIRRTRENKGYLPGIRLPESVRLATGSWPAAGAYVCAVPTQHLRATLAGLAADGKPVLSVAKGIENGTLERPSGILREIFGRPIVTVLSGPSHAEEVGRGLPATVVAASPREEHARFWQDRLSGGPFRIYTSDDPAGVELGGALKNVIAIAAGICDGLRLGDNAKAALLSRGIVEIARLGVTLGARKQTFFGLSGIGDLITTCYSPHGRNLKVGREIGAGRRLADVLAGMSMVAEGVWTAKAVKALAKRQGVEMPICEEVHAMLHEDKPPLEALKCLLGRLPKSEAEDLA